MSAVGVIRMNLSPPSVFVGEMQKGPGPIILSPSAE